eukprot:SAG31_NODE_47276_length_251_cov_0.664474_1_plen_83_part_11
MMLLNLFKAVELRLNTHVVKIMDATLASRSTANFKSGLVLSLGVAVLGSWLRIIYGYMQVPCRALPHRPVFKRLGPPAAHGVA